MPRLTNWLVGAAAVFASACSGCTKSDGLGRVVVTGHVKYQGAAVEDGQIRFIPQPGTQGPITIAPIASGQYRCDHAGGVPLGTHRVEILSFHPDDPEPQGPGETPRRQLAPAKYNKQSQLLWMLEDQAGPVTKDFDLQ